MKRFLAILAVLTALCGSQPILAGPPPAPDPVSILCSTCQKSLSVTNASARTALPSTAAANIALTVYNAGAKDAYFAQGDSSVTATTGNIRLPAGGVITVWVSGTYLAAITGGTDTTTLYLYQANGPISFIGPGGGGGAGIITANQGTAGSQAWLVNSVQQPIAALTQTTVTLSAGVSAQLVAANSSRKYLKWMVTGAGNMTVVPGSSAAVVNAGVNYQGNSGSGTQGASETFDAVISQQAFQAISSAGTTVTIWEGQ